MKILVAGATGAIGSRLVPLLVSGGHHVIATTRTPDSRIDTALVFLRELDRFVR